MFEQVSIIGCGLIGSSVFRALKKNGSVKKVITFDNDKSVCEIIKKENLSDKIVSTPEEAVNNADLVLISTHRNFSPARSSRNRNYRRLWR